MRHIVLIICLIVSGCGQKEQKPVLDARLFEGPVSVGVVDSKKIGEASGLVASMANEGFLWTHNDSGNDPDIFLINRKGEIVCTVHLDDAKNRDWEDITLGSGPEPGKTYLYVGDIGDNNAIYDNKFLYRLEEPRIAAGISDTTIKSVAKIKFKLSDGARDTESIAFDPVSGDFYILSKRESKVNLYALRSPLSEIETMEAKRVQKNLPFTQLVAMNISKDGSEILAKNYDQVFYWKREAGTTVEATLSQKPMLLPYEAEPQGESITFAGDGSGYFTISEQKEKNRKSCFSINVIFKFF